MLIKFKIFLKIISFSLIIISLIYISPLKLILFIFLIYPEQILFIYDISLIFYCKNSIGYFKFINKKVDTSNLSLFHIWIEICKLQSFIRIYSLLNLKKFNSIALLKSFLIIYYNIPMKLINLIHFWCFSEYSSTREIAQQFYWERWLMSKSLSIEILEGKIFLNCFTFEKLIFKLKIIDPNIKRNEALNLVSELKSYFNNKSPFDHRMKKERIILNLAKISINGNPQIPRHFTFFEGGNTIHGTSNSNFSLHQSQMKDLALPSLIKVGSQNPSSIITINPNKVDFFNQSVEISKIELDRLKLNYPTLFYVPVSKEDYLWNKELEIFNIVNKNIMGDYASRQYLAYELNLGNYEILIENMSISDMRDVIIKEINS